MRARFGYRIASQLLSSLSNFAITIAVARSAATDELGGFAITMTVYSLALVTVRSAVGQTAVIFGHSRKLVQLVGALVGLGLAILLFVPTAVLSSQPLLTLMLCIGLPLILAQDSLRSLDIGVGSARNAAVADALWLGVFLAGWGVLIVAGLASMEIVFAVWVVAGSASLLPLAVGELPDRLLQSVRQWWSETRSISSAMLFDSVGLLFANQAVIVAMGIVASLNEIGEIRAAQIVLSPANLLASLLPLIMIPKISEWDRTGRHQGGVAPIALGAATVPLALYGVAEFLPERFGTAIFGASWLPSQVYLLPVAIGTSAALLIMAISSVLRARREAKGLSLSRLIGLPVEVAGPFVGILFGPPGVSAGLALGQVVSAAPWIYFVGRSQRDVRLYGPAYLSPRRDGGGVVDGSD